MSLHSPGDVIYMLKDVYAIAKDNWQVIFGLLIFFGGGSAVSFKVPGAVDIIKKILATPEELRAQKLDNDAKELDNQIKRLTIQQKIKDSGISPESLTAPIEAIIESTTSLQVEPIVVGDQASLINPIDDENEESIDTEDE